MKNYALPLAVIPPNEGLYQLTGQLKHHSVFINYIDQDITAFHSDPHEAIPIIRLPASFTPATAHRFKTQLLSRNTSTPFIYALPRNYQEFQQGVRNPDLDFLLLSIGDLDSVINQESTSTAKNYHKILLLDLTSLLITYGYQRSHLIHKTLMRSHFLHQNLLIMPVTFPSLTHPEYARPLSSILSLIQLLQIPISKIISKTQHLSSLISQYKHQQDLAPTLPINPSSMDLEKEISSFPFDLPPLWRPHPRIPQRYLLLKLHFPSAKPELNEKSLQRFLNQNFHYLYGEITGAHTHLRIIEYTEDSQQMIIRTTPRTLPHVRVLLALLTHLDKIPVIPSILSISGTLKGLRSR